MNMQTLVAHIDGVGLLGPGLNDWTEAAAILAGRFPYAIGQTPLPAPALPPAERRRCGPIVKLSLAVGFQAAAHAGVDVKQLATVFAASGGDGGNCHAICEQLATDDKAISPTRFHNSVHNAAAGYWSIAAGSMAPSSVICAFDDSFGAGLIEAMAQVHCEGRASMLVACDTGYPEPLRSHRPMPDAFGLALVLSPVRGPNTLGQLKLRLQPGDAGEVTRLADPALERLRTSIPAARALPLLSALAAGQPASIVIDHLGHSRLLLELVA